MIHFIQNKFPLKSLSRLDTIKQKMGEVERHGSEDRH